MKKAIKNLDLRALPPFERHSKILGMWNSLKEGEALKITNDHEPRPLYYQFDAEYKGQFKWEYEKQGPEEWVFTIKKVSGKADKKQEIKNLIKQLKTERDAGKLKEKARRIFSNVSPTDLGLIEQEIIEEGATRKEMRKMCDIHLEVMKESMGKTELNLKPGHPIHTLMEEHKMILGFIEKLKENVRKIENARNLDGASEQIELLKHIAEHLVEADKHHQREEEVLFPALERFGVSEPPEIMREEHEELKPKKKELYKIAKEYKNMPYPKFAMRVKKTAEYLIEALPKHIYKEDNILYPMAVQVIPKKEWPEIKKNATGLATAVLPRKIKSWKIRG